MSILTINNLTHTFDGNVIFEGACLSVNNGEHTGIVGLNGAGKSTFMNILTGRLIQDDGEVKWLNGIKRGYLDQHADIDRNQTVMEYLQSSFKQLYALNDRLEQVYTSMETERDADALDALISRSASMLDELTKEGFFELDSEIKKVGNGLGIGAIGYDTPIAILSGGQRAKVMLASLLLSDYDILLLDEPTNFLDVEHIKWLTDYINTYKSTVLVISHDTDFLNSVSRNIISVEGHGIKKYSGDYNRFLAASEINAKQHEESFERQQQQIKKLEEFISKNKARAATAGMANSRKKQLDKLEIISKPTVIYPAVFRFPYVNTHSNEILEVKDLVIGYNNKPLLPPISFKMSSETKLLIRGTNGIGKSTLLKTLLRRIPAISGFGSFHINAKTLYLEQDLEFYNEEESAVAYITRCYPRLDSKAVRTQLGGVGIKNDLATKPICNLSGGEQVKVKLCALMQKESNFLLLDEPTNHLDIKAKESLAEALIGYGGAVILVTHERAFADKVCNDVLDWGC
ncbi:MAG: ATP-binding cassette domain-containing protein [Clostridiaceae bacterium]|jgi:ATPase subunit of ABC transporter with duplicated ATPase domains|nr:ATP-binding cassette domain-containing protein [Clostridiaceae bacterium]